MRIWRKLNKNNDREGRPIYCRVSPTLAQLEVVKQKPPALVDLTVKIVFCFVWESYR